MHSADDILSSFLSPRHVRVFFLPKGLNMNKLSNNILNLMRKKKTESNIFVACPIGGNMVMVGQIVQIDIDFLLSDLS